ncbi:MAG: hypothetical protein ACU85E_16210 [Gammaproteobacteria bacterium]
MIVGVGGLNNVPIPKYDDEGKPVGFYKADEVPHRSTFGIPSQLPVDAGNYHARNAPFGGANVTGDQHMSRLYESYLQQLSGEAGWLITVWKHWINLFHPCKAKSLPKINGSLKISGSIQPLPHCFC